MISFGDSPLSVRLPSIASFLLASYLLQRIVAKRLGGLFGLVAMGTLWCFFHVFYAVEARPYALMLALFTCALYCWLEAIEADGRSWWHLGLGASIALLFLSHCFAPLLGAALGAGEMV